MEPSVSPATRPAPRPWRLDGAVCLAVFLACMGLYRLAPLRVQTDSIWSIPTAVSIIREGNIDLDEYRDQARVGVHGIAQHNGRLYNFFPLGPSLAALPYVWPRHAWSMAHRDDDKTSRSWAKNLEPGHLDVGFFARAENGVASVYCALAAIFVYLTARRRLTVGPALLVATVFAFGTSVFSTASRVLWQHGPSVAALAAIVWLVSGERWNGRRALALGCLLGLSYVMRPTNAISVAIIGAWWVLTHPRLSGAAALGLLSVLVPWAAFNHSVWQTWLPPYYQATRLDLDMRLVGEALLGNLISPGRGLFIFTPVAFAAVVGVVLKVRAHTLARHELAFLAVLFGHWCAVSTFPHWWAGHSFGNRFFTDVTPYWAYFLIPTMEWLCHPVPRWIRAAMAILAVASLAIHTRGSSRDECWYWNSDIDEKPQRLWDWTDLQFLR